jgi:anti-anti-sigma factor
VLSQHIEPFSCDVRPSGDDMIVAPRGELDMATVGAVEQELRRLQRKGARSIVLDLRGLSFIDSSGLHLVTRWAAESSRDGFGFALEPGSPIVQRIFELAAVTDELPFRDGGS